MLCGQFDYTPLRDQPFAATLRVLCVGDMVVQHATTAAHVARGGIARGMAVPVLNVQGTHRVARQRRRGGCDGGGAGRRRRRA
jgi:hypothetical protein